MATKKCGCCGAQYTAEGWAALPLKGLQPAGEEDGYVFTLTLKDCSCGSTLATESKEVAP